MNLQQSAKDRAEQLTADRLSVEKFAVGQSVPRKEDPMLLRGQGHYTDDVSLPGQAYAVMVRSQNAHGVIRSIDTEAARKMPGVLGVYTAADLKGYGPLKCVVPFNNRDGSPMKKPLREALAIGKVRYVGDPVAFVVAETVHAAKDAAEAVVVDIESLPAVTAAEDAAQPGAPQLYDDVPGNVALDYHYGDAEAVKAAFAKAAHVTKLQLVNSRLVVAAMEPRAALAAYDGQRFTLYVGSQGVFGMRANIAEALGVDAEGRARADRPGRRLVRHEGRGVSRIHLHAARRARARPPGEVDRRALRQLCLRQPRPQSRRHRRTRARCRRQIPRRAPDELRQCRRVPLAGGADAGHAQCGEERAGHVPHAADRSLDQGACSPTPRTSPPIAAPAGPRATITWSAWSMPPRPRWASIAWRCASATRSRRANCRARSRRAAPTTAAISRR